MREVSVASPWYTQTPSSFLSTTFWRAALEYLLGEKLLTFAKTADCCSEFAAEFPCFQAEVWNVFNRYEIAGYLTTLKAFFQFAPVNLD